jgi:S-adenosylmethionine:tRNA ribosyltransferase-isomerase
LYDTDGKMQNPDLQLSNYDFELPSELIAERPIEGRHHSRLLVYKISTNEVSHHRFYELPKLLPKDHLLVLNQSRVFPCRLIGQKSSGGKCEVFLLSLLDNNGIYPAMIKTRGKKKIGDRYQFDELEVEVVAIASDGSFGVRFNLEQSALMDFLEAKAQIPIPPYIRGGEADEKDSEDYQTVYAKEAGSVAAPTAGLHFTKQVFEDLEKEGIDKAFVTLHVGAGTFKPVTSDNILEHQMHSEYYDISKENLEKIQNYGNKLIAVGTTSLRTLESCWQGEKIDLPGEPPCSTDIFIHPGKEVQSIRGIITNFHLPKSSLLMLVSAMIGREKALELYALAIQEKYRFFSYGDAMLILR